MKITIRKDGAAEKVTLPAGARVRDAAAKNSLQEVLLLLNGKIAHPDTTLKDGDEVELQGVIYGG